MASGVFVAVETFHVTTADGTRIVRKGDLADGDSPIRKAYPQYFKPVEERLALKADAPVEQATAAPGQRRNR